MKHVKKVALVLMAVMMIGVGVSMAYLHFTSDTATNTFSSNKKLSLLLREPTWDGYGFDDSYGQGTLPGQVANPDVVDQTILGITKASNYYPGDIIPKNPIVKNTSVDGEYVAIKVEYILSKNGVETTLTNAEFQTKFGKMKANVDQNNDGIHDAYTNISENTQYDLYMLGTKDIPTSLQSNIVTPELFNSVNIANDIQLDANGNLPSFQIKVTAYAVQSVNVDASTAVTELNRLAKQ